MDDSVVLRFSKRDGTTLQLAIPLSTTELKLSNKQITSVPPEITRLTNLSTIFLDQNYLTKFPEIYALKNLESLSLNHNQITSIPAEIGNLINLKSLNFYFNQLTYISPEIGRLTKLFWFAVGHNQLKRLPDEIGNLRKLTNFYCNGNPYTDSRLQKFIGCAHDVSDEILAMFPPVVMPQKSISQSYYSSPIQNPAQQQGAKVGRFLSMINESVKYKGALVFPEGYIPYGSLKEILLANKSVLALKIPKLGFILEDCEQACNSCMNDPSVQRLVRNYGLTRDVVYSIILYTYDLGMQGKPSENFYFQINEILRNRSINEMEAIKGYLYYVLSGLRKLPSISTVVYRGNNAPDIVKQEYLQGREIFWSGFTSTTTDLRTALPFAGNNGVVFRIKINNGKDISSLSVMGNEHEVLLPPNSCLVVFNPIHVESDGIQYVDMVEKAGSFKW